MAAQLNLNMRSFSYYGEKRGFNLQKFVKLHKGQHSINYGLIKYGYSGVDENYKVHILMNGINTNALDAYKAAILDIPEIKGDFDIAERKLIDFIDMNPSIQKNSTEKVSSLTKSGG